MLLNFLRTFTIAITALILGSPAAMAQYGGESSEVTPIIDVREGQKANQLILETEFRNGCYSSLRSFKHLRGTDSVVVVHLARVEMGKACTQAISYQTFNLSMADLNEGTYNLVDGYDGSVIGSIRKTSERTELIGAGEVTPEPSPSPGLPTDPQPVPPEDPAPIPVPPTNPIPVPDEPGVMDASEIEEGDSNVEDETSEESAEPLDEENLLEEEVTPDQPTPMPSDAPEIPGGF